MFCINDMCIQFSCGIQFPQVLRAQSCQLLGYPIYVNEAGTVEAHVYIYYADPYHVIQLPIRWDTVFGADTQYIDNIAISNILRRTYPKPITHAFTCIINYRRRRAGDQSSSSINWDCAQMLRSSFYLIWWATVNSMVLILHRRKRPQIWNLCISKM